MPAMAVNKTAHSAAVESRMDVPGGTGVPRAFALPVLESAAESAALEARLLVLVEPRKVGAAPDELEDDAPEDDFESLGFALCCFLTSCVYSTSR